MGTATDPAIYEFGEFVLDPTAHVLYSRADGKPIATTPRVLDTLLYFIEHRDELLDKSTLMARVWPNVVVEENSLNQLISAIRRALGEKPGEPRYVLTVAGRGYRFVSEVSVRARSADGASRSESAMTPVPPASVAVLPFASLGDDPERAHFGDGMAEELIHRLSRVRGLKVPARTSAFAYKGRSLHVKQIARELGVATVLEGSVRGDGNHIRVTAQLVDATSGYHLWSETFDREFQDVFALQDELSRSIVHALARHLDIALPMMEHQPPPTRSPSAYPLYVQARALQERPNEQSLRSAIALYREATKQDPSFARAYAGAATASLSLVSMAFEFEEALSSAERDARRALALDPGLAEPHAALGTLYSFRAKILAAETHLRTAQFLDATDPRLLTLHVINVAAVVGHMSKAHELLSTAYEMAPAYAATLMALGFLAIQRGQNDEALRCVDMAAALGLSPNALPIPFIRAQVAWRERQREKFVQNALTLFAREPSVGVIAQLIETVYESTADGAPKDVAASQLRRLALDPRHRCIDPMKYPRPLLLWATLLGDLDLAYELVGCVLDQLARSGTLRVAAGYCNQFWQPEMTPFRRDARFHSVADKLGLSEYWAVHGAADSDLQ